MTAIYFVGSALRARRYLSIGDSEGATTGAVANKTAMQRLMGRVLTSGCLMLVNVLTLAVGLPFLFHPVGFTICYTIGGLVTMANSILQLASFAPPAGAPAGPIEEARLALKKTRATRSPPFRRVSERRKPPSWPQALALSDWRRTETRGTCRRWREPGRAEALIICHGCASLGHSSARFRAFCFTRGTDGDYAFGNQPTPVRAERCQL